jgi:hypothetical protein
MFSTMKIFSHSYCPSAVDKELGNPLAIGSKAKIAEGEYSGTLEAGVYVWI